MRDINTINLFVACSSTSDNLNEKKKELMKMCNDMNIEFADKNQCFAISPVSYEDLERRMLVFTDYIENKADIVVFLIDETFGPFLEEKLQLAANRAYSYSKPELLVFVSKDIDDELEQKIKVILKRDGWLYDYLDQNMLASVKKRIKGFVGEYENKRRKRIRNQIIHWCGVGLVILLGVWGGYKIINLRKQIEKLETKRLLITGGGSARNYIEKKYLENNELVKLNPDFWWYAPMPSGEAYRIIAEEIINFSEDEDYKARPYYPIAISAEEITNDNVFTKNISFDIFKKTAIVAGIHLGDDSLVVYSNSNTVLKSPSIECSRLEELTQDSIIVLRTSLTSGTFRSYTKNSVCPSLNSRNDLILFTDSDTISKRFKNNWIALGSKYYGPRDQNAVQSLVKNNKGIIERKPICIYFLLYKDKVSNKYTLPDVTKEFLTKLQNNDTTFKGVINRIENINQFITEADNIEADSSVLYYITDSAIIHYINDTTILQYH